MKDTLVGFDSEESFLNALHRLERKGVSFDAFSPHDIKRDPSFAGRDSAFNGVKLFALLGGIAGLLGSAFLMWFANTLSAPLDIGGRPLASWPAFIPVLFVLTILGAAVAAVFALILRLNLPELHHPVFEFRSFGSRDGFYYLWIPKSRLGDLEGCPRRTVESR